VAETTTTLRPRADAVVGWRYWQLSRSGLLRSVTQRGTEWEPGAIVHARCLGGGHPAPDERCECGVHAARDLDTLREHGLCLAPEALVVGEVALWGRVVSEEARFRGEHAVPVRLSVVRDLLAPEELPGVVERMGAYGVPVATVDLTDAVAGVSAATLAFQAMAARASRTSAG
jgi:hypothetical protein